MFNRFFSIVTFNNNSAFIIIVLIKYPIMLWISGNVLPEDAVAIHPPFLPVKTNSTTLKTNVKKENNDI